MLIAGVVVLLAVGRPGVTCGGARAWHHGRADAAVAGPPGAVLALGLGLVCCSAAAAKGLPVVPLMMAVLTAVYAFVTQRMVVGRRPLRPRWQREGCALSGVQTERLVFASFVNLGVLTALAGLIRRALNTATPKAGLGMELDVIAACFIGGARPSGGGAVGGAVIGAFVMGVMNTACRCSGSASTCNRSSRVWCWPPSARRAAVEA